MVKAGRVTAFQTSAPAVADIVPARTTGPDVPVPHATQADDEGQTTLERDVTAAGRVSSLIVPGVVGFSHRITPWATVPV